MTATTTVTLAPLAAPSAFRLPTPPKRRRRGWAVAVSVLLHLALLALAIVAAQHKRSSPESVPPASVAMVFENGGTTAPSIANPAPVSPNRQASPEQQPATPTPPPPAPPAEVPPPPREITPPAPQEVTPPPPTPTPPVPAPQSTPQPQPELSPPPTAPPAQPPTPEAVPLPLPPPPPVPAPEAAPKPAPPRPREAARPVSPPRTAPAFPAPMDFSLGPRFSQEPRVARREATPPQPHTSPGTIDLSFAPILGGGDITQLHPQGKGQDVGEDWFNEVAAWWLRHRFYPSEAGRLNQEGDVQLRLVVGRGGRVEAVDVEQRSGSPWLDLGALAVFRGANLPPLPPDVTDPNITVDFTIHYIILR